MPDMRRRAAAADTYKSIVCSDRSSSLATIAFRCCTYSHLLSSRGEERRSRFMRASLAFSRKGQKV